MLPRPLRLRLVDGWGVPGAGGTARDIIYPGGVGYVPPSSDSDPVFPMLIVEFPKYRGPPLLEDAASATAHPHLVPIVPTTVRCMDRIADAANEQVAQRDTARTFEAGLAWFCAHVKSSCF